MGGEVATGEAGDKLFYILELGNQSKVFFGQYNYSKFLNINIKTSRIYSIFLKINSLFQTEIYMVDLRLDLNNFFISDPDNFFVHT